MTGWTERAGRCVGALALVGVATLGLSGCGGDSSDTATAGMALDWVFTPEPATAVASAEDGFDWTVPYRVTLTETGGQGGSITDVTVNVYEAVDGEPGAEATSAESSLEYQSNRIDARATVALDFDTNYTLPNGGTAAIVDVFLFLVDDDGRNAQIGKRLLVQ